MRILIVTPWFPTAASPSSGVFVLRDALALARRHEVRVVHLVSPALLGDEPLRTTVDHADGAVTGARPAVEPDAAPVARAEATATVEVLRVPVDRRSPAAWARAGRTVRAAAREADVVHTQAISGLVAFALRRPAGRTPWVHTEHWSALTAPQTLPPLGRAAMPLLVRLLARPDVVTVACERLAAPVRAVRRRRRDDGVVLVPCLVPPPARVVEPPRDGPEVRLVGIGSLIARKDPACAVATVAELHGRGVPASLTWVGAGPEHDRVLDLAVRLGIAEHVRLLGDQPPAVVTGTLEAGDLLLLPTHGDNFCIVVAEALSAGRPVVSGAATGASEYTDPRTGVFVADQEPGAYADAVQTVLASTASMTAAQIAATVAGRFTATTVAGRYTEVYERLVGR